MIPYAHLHVHSYYSLLDGQASIARLVDKALADGMRGMALTDHGNMMGVKDFYNYVNKKKGAAAKEKKAAEAKLTALREGTYENAPDKNGVNPDAGKTNEELIAECEKQIEKTQRVLDFKPIYGCEMYCARRTRRTRPTAAAGTSSSWPRTKPATTISSSS